jgi:adenosylmethionine-8-amino-7-oxononanoate aminotransferase
VTPVDRQAIVLADRHHVWPPYTPADAHEVSDPLVVVAAEGSWLTDADGRRYLDGNSSWWVANLGHRHPRLVRRLTAQASTLAHVAMAGITHAPAALLAEELTDVAPRGDASGPVLTRVFYTDNGSTAVEAAIKVATQFWQQAGRPGKKRFLALDGAFHGDTVGAASLGGVEIFRRPFAGILFDCVRAPSPGSTASPDAHGRAFEVLGALVRKHKDELAAVVVEPLLQGADGMRMYDAAWLRALRECCTENDVLLIVDEVFTGYGRTGRMWACDHAGIAPDLLCLGKSFASLLPMGAMMSTERIYDAFRGGKDRAFYYGHTFYGHPLGAALAREVLAIYRDEAVVEQAAAKAPAIAEAMRSLGEAPGVLRHRSLGMVGAVDLGEGGYGGELGWRVYAEGKRRGAYLRPLGDTVYVCPPLTISREDLDTLLAVFSESVRAALADARS